MYGNFVFSNIFIIKWSKSVDKLILRVGGFGCT